MNGFDVGPPSGRGQNRPIGVPRRSVGNSRHRNSPSSSTFAPSITDSTNASSVVSRLARSIGNPPMPGRNHSGSRSSIAVDIGTGTSGVGSTGSRSGTAVSARMMLDANRRRTAAVASNEPRNILNRAPAAIRSPSGLTATAEVGALETNWSRVIASASWVRMSRLARVGRSPDGPASRLAAPITVVKLRREGDALVGGDLGGHPHRRRRGRRGVDGRRVQPGRHHVVQFGGRRFRRRDRREFGGRVARRHRLGDLTGGRPGAQRGGAGGPPDDAGGADQPRQGGAVHTGRVRR